MSSVERLVRLGAELAECPLWLPDQQRLVWVDILAGRVNHADANGAGVETVEVGEPVGAVAATDEGVLVAATPRGLRVVGADGALLAGLPRSSPELRMNDGKTDPAGRFVGGTMSLGDPRPGVGSLWSFDGPIVTELLAGTTISNGLCWSSDGETMFYVDTPTQRIDAFDYDVATGAISERRAIVTIDPSLGAPDGLAIDDAGGLWVALWGGEAVHRYEEGRLTEIVTLPTPYVTCPAFFGAGLDRLAITTAAGPFGGDPPDGAGDVYVASVGARGTPAAPCAPDGHRLSDTEVFT